MAMKVCKECKKEISSSAAKCPECGKDQRNWVMRHKFLTVVLAIIFLIVIGNSGKKSTPNQSSNQPEQKSQATKIPELVYKVGEVIKTDKYEITITSAEERNVVGSQYFEKKPSEGGIFIAIQWKYKNVSEKPIGSFSTPSIKLIDENGIEYSSDIGAGSDFATELKLDRKILSDLNPGITVNDAQVFEVSKEKFNKETWRILIKADGKDLKTAFN